MKEFLTKYKLRHVAKALLNITLSFIIGFSSFFTAGFLFILVFTIIASILQWIGFSTSIGLFADERLATSEFYSSQKFSQILVIGIIILALTLISVILEYKDFTRIIGKKIDIPNEVKKEKFIGKNIDRYVKKTFIKFVKFIYRPSIITLEIMVFIILLYSFSDNIYSWLGLDIPDTNAGKTAQFYRNRGFALVAFIGLFATTIGMALTVWGRVQTGKQTEQTQKQIEQTQDQIKLSREANTSERYENAARMLENDAFTVRAAGLHTLQNLGSSDIEDQPTVAQCVNLLATYISNPYLDKYEKKEIDEKIKVDMENGMKRTKLEALFEFNEEFRADIQIAIDGIFAIYESFSSRESSKKHELERTRLKLPPYFWKNMKKTKVNFSHANLTGANLHSADLLNSNLSFCNLEGADLSNVNFEEVDLSEANLHEANLYSATFIDCILSGTSFSRANLADANLQGATLDGADFIKADLSNANLSYTGLSSAILSEADLEYANLIDADLYGADLSNANLTEADIGIANLEEADLSGAQMGTVRNLSMKQIFRSKWVGKSVEGQYKPNPPTLPDEFMQDRKVRRWLKDEDYYGEDF